MLRKILSSANGPILQLTLTPWESIVLKTLAKKADLPAITCEINAQKPADPNYTNVMSVGVVVKQLYRMMEV